MTSPRRGPRLGIRAAPAVAASVAAVVAVVAAAAGAVVGGVRVPVAIVTAVVVLYVLARRRTAGASALGVVGAAVVTAVAVAAGGASPRITAAGAALALGAGAALWALGRSRRRRAAAREGSAEYVLQAAAVSRQAARAERSRFAAELHDVVAHRLTGVVVSAGAARRLSARSPDGPALRDEAIRHAGEAGRAALAELDALGDALDPPRALADLDALVAAHPGARYRRGVAEATEEAVALAFRVSREALTNAARYASGTPVHVRVYADGHDLVVEVRDSGGAAAGSGLGSGTGLEALRRAVAATGGGLDAGPEGSGWAVRARLPQAVPAPWSPLPRMPLISRMWRTVAGRTALGPRGTRALDTALALLAFALPLGAGLIPAGGPDVFATSGPGRALLAVLLAAHAAPLVFRRALPRVAPFAASVALLAWLACDRSGWTAPHSTDMLLWCWWADLALVHSAASNAPGGRNARRTWPVPVAVAAVAGLALVSDGVTHVLAGWAVFTGGAAVPALTVWALGLRAGARRRARAAAETSLRDTVERDAAEAARAERLRLVRGLRDTARARVAAVVAAAHRGDLDGVLAEARAAMTAMRELLAGLRADPAADDDLPPTVASLTALGARYRAVTRLTGAVRPLPGAVEVAAYRAVEALMTDEARVTVRFAPDGLEITVAPRRDPGPPRALRAMVDAAGGTLTATADGTVRVWLPEKIET